MAESDLYYRGIQGTVLTLNGSQAVIGPNTVVHRDSEIRVAFPSLFEPLHVDYDAPPPPEPKAAEKAASEPEKAHEKRATHTR